MAKKKKSSSRGKSKAPVAPQHSLPNGFWSQVWAVGLISLSLLLVVAWFGAGGPVLNWLHTTLIGFIG